MVAPKSPGTRVSLEVTVPESVTNQEPVKLKRRNLPRRLGDAPDWGNNQSSLFDVWKFYFGNEKKLENDAYFRLIAFLEAKRKKAEEEGIKEESTLEQIKALEKEQEMEDAELQQQQDQHCVHHQVKQHQEQQQERQEQEEGQEQQEQATDEGKQPEQPTEQTAPTNSDNNSETQKSTETGADPTEPAE